MNLKKKIKCLFSYLILFVLCISCGVTDRIEIPLTKEEITFFNELNHHPFTIDSVTREIAINRLMWYKDSENADIEIYISSSIDNLTVKDWNLLSDKVAHFYSIQKINGIEFTDCYITYHLHEKQNTKYYYSYHIKNNLINIKSKSYELEKEEKELLK